jgi:hypothetical protein
VTIERVSQGTTGYWPPFSIITIADYTFDQSGGSLKRQWGPKVAIAHELAHWWDRKVSSPWFEWKLSSGLRDVVRNEPSPTLYGYSDAQEEWAESVAGYLFPVYFVYLAAEDPQEVGQYVDPLGFVIALPGLGPRHYAYVAAQFRNLSGSTP